MKQKTEGWIDDRDVESSLMEGSFAGKRLIRDLIGRWYWVVLGVMLGASGTMYYLSKARPEYAASASLLVKQQTSGVLGKEQPEEMDMRSADALNTVVEQVKRRSLLEKVAVREEVRQIEGLVPRPVRWLPATLEGWMGRGAATDARPEAAPSPKALAGFIASRMTVSIRRRTRLLDIKVSHPSPEAARVLADAVTEEYVTEISSKRSSGRTSSIEVLSKKSDEARNLLQEAQKASASYVRALGCHEQLEAKESEMSDLRRRYLPKHPAIVTCDGQIKALQKRFLEDFRAAVKSGEDHAYWKQAQLNMDSGEDDLTERLEMARQALLARTAVLRSEIQSQELVFNAILNKIGETDVNQGATESEVEISSSAMLPGLPVSPVRSRTLVMGLFTGGAFGLMLAFISIRIDNKFHSVADLEGHTGVPVLGALVQLPMKHINGLINSEDAAVKDYERSWKASVVFRSALSTTNFAEMIRVLRASVSLLGPEDHRKVTMFTSAIPGEGKTFCAVNFALAAAAQGKRVLLMDLDLRKPSTHQLFGIAQDSNHLGASGYLAGKGSLQDAVISEGLPPNLNLMLAGARCPNPGELLAGTVLGRVFDEVCPSYDVVVIDTAPLLAVPDARLIARFAQNICLIVRAGYVPKDAVKRALEVLSSGRTTVSGIVFNGFREKRSPFDSNYSYGSYRFGARGKAYRYGYGNYGAYGSDTK